MTDMLRPLTRDESRAIDHRAAAIGLPTLVLMENAGRGAADLLDREAPPSSRILIACGPGNNGGDGGVIARHLDARGRSVRVVWFAPADKIAGDAAVQHRILAASGVDQTEVADPVDDATLDDLMSGADWVVDALLGTGLTRPVAGVMRQVVAAMNRSGKPILAIDIPSGLDADSGQPMGEAVRATITATFVSAKTGFARPGTSSATGRVVVLPIGVPRILLEEFALEPHPRSDRDAPR